jgi:hypothetical protein
LTVGSAEDGRTARRDARCPIGSVERQPNRMVEPFVVVGRSLGLDTNDFRRSPIDSDPDGVAHRYVPPHDRARALCSALGRNGSVLTTRNLSGILRPRPLQGHARPRVPTLAIVVCRGSVTRMAYRLRVCKRRSTERERDDKTDDDRRRLGSVHRLLFVLTPARRVRDVPSSQRGCAPSGIAITHLRHGNARRVHARARRYYAPSKLAGLLPHASQRRLHLRSARRTKSGRAGRIVTPTPVASGRSGSAFGA